jgi:Straboviridae DNA primase
MIDFNDEDKLVDAIESALNLCENVIKRTREKYNFRCNICGDSLKRLKLRRAWVYKSKKGVWKFNCFNECGSMGAGFWVKKYFPEIWSEYIKSILRKETKSKEKKQITFKDISNIKNEVVKKSNKFPFRKIIGSDLKIAKDAIDYCEKRKISKDVYSQWFICNEKIKEQELDYQGRLIIPFYNKDKKVNYFLARSLYGQEPKYKCAPGSKQIYNIDFIDKSKEVIFLEGPLDSLFCENAIAITGLQIGEEQEEKVKELNLYYLLDGDAPGKKKSIEFLKQGRWVFNWKKFLVDNDLPEQEKWDVNDLYIKLNRTEKFTFKELEKYFVNNIYNQSYFI